MTHTSTEQPSLAAIIRDLRESHARTSPGAWGKGATTHETVSRAEGREPYKVAEFRHANDAQFCDLAHVFVPRLLSEIEALQSRVQELEASQAQRVPLDAYKLREIFKKLNANHDKEGWDFSDLVREVEAYHGITNQKCSGCSGVGLVGGLTHDGYVSEECPFCKGSGIDNGITQENQA